MIQSDILVFVKHEGRQRYQDFFFFTSLFIKRTFSFQFRRYWRVSTMWRVSGPPGSKIALLLQFGIRKRSKHR